jgi:hypothetical protein
MPEEDYNRWRRENLYYYDRKWAYGFKKLPKDEQPVKGTMYTKEEVINFYKKTGEFNEDNINEDYTVDEFINEMGDFDSYEGWSDSDWEEYNEYEYTTPGGEKLIIETKCGRDG